MEALGPLFSLAVLGAIIAAIVYGVRSVTKRRRDFAEVNTGIGTVRRLYFYTISLVALLMSSYGIVVIGGFILEAMFGSDRFTRSGDETLLATGLALTIVGLPLWVFHWRIIGRQVRKLPVEARSVVRKLYIYLLLGIAAGNIVAGGVDILRWAFGEVSFEGSWWPSVVVWGAVWAFHWQLETREGQPTPETRAVRRLYLYLASGVALGIALTGIGILVDSIVREAYDALANVSILTRSDLWRSSTKIALALALAATPLWATHWLIFARRDYESTLRQLYYYGYAILGGIVTILVALGVAVYHILVWVLGGAERSAGSHFDFLPWTLASLVVGASVLVYHALAVNRESVATDEGAAEGARGAYPYLLALIGVITLAVGISVLVAGAIGLLEESGRQLVASDTGRRQIALSLTLGVLGLPLWAYYWRMVQSRLIAVGAGERSSLARRGFIFSVLGIGMLALLGSVSFLAFIFFRELLDGNLSDVLREGKVGIAIIVPAAIFVPYYWMVYRKDRREGADVDEEEPRKRKAVTVIVSRQGVAQLADLESVLGYRVSPLEWTGEDAASPELSADALSEIGRQIDDAPGPNVILVPQVSSYRVISYG